jgi:ribosomal protein S18 acetylase RimI-like enzyme
VTVDLVEFDVAHAATVAGWPLSDTESFRWCGRPATPALVASWSDDVDVRAYLLVDNGEPVAYGELWLEEVETELARLIVAPAHRRRGAGHLLVTALTELARQRAVDLICLRVNPGNDTALRVYERAGFRPVDEATADEWNADQPLRYEWLTFVEEK